MSFYDRHIWANIDKSHERLDNGEILIPTLMLPLVIVGIIVEAVILAIVSVRVSILKIRGHFNGS